MTLRELITARDAINVDSYADGQLVDEVPDFGCTLGERKEG